jgi:DNA polymerase I-like protein with 3'-5' exonuclease and polymerase domains
MKNIFITRRRHNIDTPIEKRYVVDDIGRTFQIEDPIGLAEIVVTDSLDEFHYVMRNNYELGLDTENSDLNQFYAIPLLLQIAIPGLSFVIDQTSIKEDYLSMYTDRLYIGHNIQYDYRIIKYHMGIELYNLEDVMITEQIINRGTGRLNNMEDTYLRRCGKRLPEDKKTRKDFTKMNEKSIFERKHIVYSGFDPQTGFEIREVQKPIVEENKLTFRVYNIGMPLIPILGDMNLVGRTLNKEKWRENLENNKKERFRLERELDAMVAEFAKTNVKLRGGIWSSSSRKRKRSDGVQFNMFAEDTLLSTLAAKNIAYNSPHQLTKLFNILKEPLPMKVDHDRELVWGEDAPLKVSFDEPTLEQYKIEYPGSRMIEFINVLLEFKVILKEIDSFGEIFLREYMKQGKTGHKMKRGYYQPKTDKIHTIYKQEFTANGRLSSGGDKKGKDDIGIGFDNSQNWPKKEHVRSCITLTPQEIADGWWISTSDLTAAELVILASKSQDTNLMLHCRKDLHSYLATHSYTNIIQYCRSTMVSGRCYDELYQLLKVNRLQKAYRINEGNVNGIDITRLPTKQEIDSITKKRVEEALDTNAIVIDKKKYPDIREPYKNCTYGVTYGAKDDKIAGTLNIAPYYAKLAMEGIYHAIPQAMAFLDTKARQAVREGFIVCNDRTGSRHIFKSFQEARQYGRPMTNKQTSAIERFTKNFIMSATQADMVKEGMIEANNYVRANKLEFHWLMQVHDELVFKHKDKELRPVIEKILTDVCNRYLKNITMEIAGHTGHVWHKD